MTLFIISIFILMPLHIVFAGDTDNTENDESDGADSTSITRTSENSNVHGAFAPPQNQFLSNDINLAHGTVMFAETDLYLPGKNGLDLTISRIYNSKHYRSDPDINIVENTQTWGGWIGHGWSFNFAKRAFIIRTKDKERQKIIIDTNGNFEAFEYDIGMDEFVSTTPGSFNKVSFTTAEGDAWNLTKEIILQTDTGQKYLFGEKSYAEKHLDGESIVFEISGFYLTAIVDLYDNRIEFNYEDANTESSFESYNYPDNFIAYKSGGYIYQANQLFPHQTFWVGSTTTASSDSDFEKATFRIVPGLADSNAVSLESVDLPGYFFKYQGIRKAGGAFVYQTIYNGIELQKYVDDEAFKQDATFKIVPGLADESWLSFESYNHPGHYIRHKNTALYLEQGNDDTFKQDATFQKTPPLTNFVVSEKIKHIVGDSYEWLEDYSFLEAHTSEAQIFQSRPKEIKDTFDRILSISYGDANNSNIENQDVMISGISYTNVNGGKNEIKYSYDENGNLVSMQIGDLPSKEYAYTAYEPEFRWYSFYKETCNMCFCHVVEFHHRYAFENELNDLTSAYGGFVGGISGMAGKTCEDCMGFLLTNKVNSFGSTISYRAHA